MPQGPTYHIPRRIRWETVIYRKKGIVNLYLSNASWCSCFDHDCTSFLDVYGRYIYIEKGGYEVVRSREYGYGIYKWLQ